MKKNSIKIFLLLVDFVVVYFQSHNLFFFYSHVSLAFFMSRNSDKFTARKIAFCEKFSQQMTIPTFYKKICLFLFILINYIKQQKFNVYDEVNP